ncbi:aspartyl-phosphate phosphatase Spo0E family protein [Bacillus sp. REN16]|uniref:aspartyl-phosphate phosphatase Spo0E family protein n=1 Tax=Bacillus sp. REN16 TaxID=2887296 RepID=UPI002B4BE9AA|nr:aspartyl-phosphate phosphatase Spo0E family protein [Bacillus sp. REN16]MCC3359144.1 aspartyl-phosphate phosphatase Spo0E family protein [Bacillus sp. REN16]
MWKLLQESVQLNRESLILSIVQKRDEMISLASLNGMLNSKTIKCSQELDQLLNAFNKFQIN